MRQTEFHEGLPPVSGEHRIGHAVREKNSKEIALLLSNLRNKKQSLLRIRRVGKNKVCVGKNKVWHCVGKNRVLRVKKQSEANSVFSNAVPAQELQSFAWEKTDSRS